MHLHVILVHVTFEFSNFLVESYSELQSGDRCKGLIHYATAKL